MSKYRYKRKGDRPAVAGGRNSYKVFLCEAEIGYVTGTHYPFEKGRYAGRDDSGNGWWEGWALCPATGKYVALTPARSTSRRFLTRNHAAEAMVEYRIEALNGMPIEEMSELDRDLFVGRIRRDFDRGWKSVEELLEKTGLPLRHLAILLGRERLEAAKLYPTSGETDLGMLPLEASWLPNPA